MVFHAAEDRSFGRGESVRDDGPWRRGFRQSWGDFEKLEVTRMERGGERPRGCLCNSIQKLPALNRCFTGLRNHTFDRGVDEMVLEKERQTEERLGSPSSYRRLMSEIITE